MFEKIPNKNKYLITFLTSIFFSIIIFLLIYKQIVYPTVIPMLQNGTINIFADWSAILNSNICQEKGFDVYIENPCDQWNRKHVYGEILLHIPFLEKFPKFYFLIVPIIFNYLFIYVIVSFFDFKNKIEYLTIFLFLLSMPTILAIERANFDIVIFLLVVFVAKNKQLLLNHLILIFITISKFYPISLAIIFLFKKKLRNILINTIIFFIIIFTILFFQSDQLTKMFENQSQLSGYKGMYEFSFLGAIKFIKGLNIYLGSKNYNWLKYAYVFILLVIPLVITIILSSKNFLKNDSISNLFFINNFENRLYILSATIILICYFLISNYIYREIFFLGLIPWIIKEKNSINNRYFQSFFFYILSGKFLISTLLIFIERNNFFSSFKPIMIITKHCVDFYLIVIVFFIFFRAIISLCKHLIVNHVPQKV
ncbi:hypothetical protein OAD13_01770 [Candidatus Pelagibacter sp.]|nr:hypothetical protein [Candidatus Pelagibacter sp.]